MGLCSRPISGSSIRFGLMMIILAGGSFSICGADTGGQPPSPTSPSSKPLPLPGTEPLTMTGDIADAMVAEVDRFLLRQTEQSTAQRQRCWKRDFRSAPVYYVAVEPNRKRLAHLLGVRDPRVPFVGPQLVGTIARPDLLASCETFNVETPHGSPPDYHATRRGACLAWGCALPCLTGFERSAPRAIGGSQSLQTSSSVRTTNRTSVFRRRHLYRTFSKRRNIRLVRST